MKIESARYSRYFTYIKPLGKIPIIKTYGSTIFTILITTIFLLFAVKPTIETIIVLQAKLSEYKLILEKVDQKATALSLGQKNYDEISDSVKNKIYNAIPDDPRVKSIIDEIDDLSQRHDASVSAIQFQPITVAKRIPTQFGQIESVSFNVNFEGSYQNIKNLLRDMRISSRVISIETISFNQSSEGLGLVVSIAAKGYYLK